MEYQVGDVVEYRTFTGEVRRARVINREADIKNGRAGFEGKCFGVGSVWGYDDQIVSVNREEKMSELGTGKRIEVVVSFYMEAANTEEAEKRVRSVLEWVNRENAEMSCDIATIIDHDV